MSTIQAYTKMTAFLTGGDKNAEKCINLPAKLMYILQCGDYESIISWTLNGKSVIVKDTEVFVDTVLPTFFKQTKFDSFTRKMRRWKFSTRRIRTPKGIPKGVSSWVFEHPDFNKADGFATCNRVVTSDSPKEALDPLRVAYGVVPAAHGGRDTTQHHSQQLSAPPPPSGRCSHQTTNSNKVVVEGQQELAYRRRQRLVCSQELLAQREATQSALLPSHRTTPYTLSSSSTNPITATMWPNVERSEIPPSLLTSSILRSNMVDAYSVVGNMSSARVTRATGHSATTNWIGHQQSDTLRRIVSEGYTAATGNNQGWNPLREERTTTPSSINDAFSLRDLVANHAARRQKRQLVLEHLSYVSCRQGQEEETEEEKAGLIVQTLLDQHRDLVDNCLQE